jgi:heme a synthase
MNRFVRWWLLTGVVFILIQIVIGGITRLTGSGLSITKWDIVVGTLPPMNNDEWDIAFDMYKETPQYKKINQGMSLSEFKYIYFWEYIHRLWARILGFVFIIPFIFFSIKGWINRWLFRRLLIVFLLSVFVATFGWIMVASGLNERPWVNAYKLSIHLGLAMLCLIYLFITYIKTDLRGNLSPHLTKYKKIFGLVFYLMMIQILFGGIFAGMKASMIYSTWPLIGETWIPADVLMKENWVTDNFINYDSQTFMSGLIHLIHRNLGYLLGIVIIVLSILSIKRAKEKEKSYNSILIILFLVLLQISLGILTLLNSEGEVPVFYGAMHQLVAFILLLFIVDIYYRIAKVE